MSIHATVGAALLAVAIGAQSSESPNDGTTRAHASPAPEAPAEPLASFWWGDCDGDGLLDAFAVAPDGTGLLLRNRGDGSFEDATLTAGLAGIETPTAAAWEDFDCDGDLDLFVGTAFGPARLMRNLGEGSFETAHVGIDHIGWDQRAAWIDYDSDGYPDLQVRTKERDLLYHNLGQGLLEPVDLGLPEIASWTGAPPADPGIDSTEAETGPAARPAAPGTGAPPSTSGGRAPVAPGPGTAAARGPGYGGGTPAGPHTPGAPVVTCVDSIMDQANPLNCVNASSIPTFGMLYPLGNEFNIDASGNVGIGTTTPSARLMVVQDPATGRAITGLTTQSGGVGVLGNSTTISGGFGVKGEATAANGTGVLGHAIATSGTNYGVRGKTASPDGVAVYGEHLASTGYVAAVLGVTDSLDESAAGVAGLAAAGTLENYGVLGSSSSIRGVGVYGENLSTGAGGQIGVKGTTTADTAIGVLGENLSTGAGSQIGVMGATAADTAIGVLGENGASGIAVQGAALHGTGVLGEATGSMGTPTGVHGRVTYSTPNAVGVLGEHLGLATDATAVVGRSVGSAARGYGGRFEGGLAGVEGTATIVGLGQRYGGLFSASGGDGGNVGVRATGSELGVEGITSTTDGTGIYGEHMATTGTAAGVHGVTHSGDIDAAGVRGETFGSGSGVHGKSGGGPGVYGECTGGYDPGVLGISATVPNQGIGGMFQGGSTGVWSAAWDSGTGDRYGGRFYGSSPEGPTRTEASSVASRVPGSTWASRLLVLPCRMLPWPSGLELAAVPIHGVATATAWTPMPWPTMTAAAAPTARPMACTQRPLPTSRAKTTACTAWPPTLRWQGR